MALSFNTLQSFQSLQAANIYNVLGRTQPGMTASFFGNKPKERTLELDSAQKQMISQLQDFVGKHVAAGPQADKLMASINGLSQLMRSNNTLNAFPNPIGQLLDKNPVFASSLTSGALINRFF